MALGLVKRWSFVPMMAYVAIVQGCSSSPADGEDSGCSKDTDCASGRICQNRACVDRSNTGAGGTGTGGTGGTSGTSGTSGSPSVGTACVESDPILCPTQNDMLLCVAGSYEAFTCPEACEGILYLETGPCTGVDGCECGAPLDAQCDLGVSAFCACSTAGCGADSEFDPLSVYIDCASGTLAAEDQEFLACLGGQIMSDMIDCAAASDACVPM